MGENPYTVVTDDYNESDNKFNGRFAIQPQRGRTEVDRGDAGHWCWTTERDIAETEAMNRVHERSRTPPSAGGGIDGATCSEDADLGGPHEGARWEREAQCRGRPAWARYRRCVRNKEDRPPDAARVMGEFVPRRPSQRRA